MAESTPAVPTTTETTGGEAGGVAVATRPAPAPAPASAPTRLDRLPPFKVLLHNDAVNDMGHVVRSIVELTPLKKEEAVERMVEAHNTGVSLLLVTHKERAELYRDQFRTKRLNVSLEPAQ